MKPRHLVDGAHGVLVAQVFATDFPIEGWGVSDEDAGILQEGPGHPEYAATYAKVLDEAYFIDPADGKMYGLYQSVSGDLIAVCIC